MEGYLKKYTNLLQRWQQRYFVLNNEILVYCDDKGGPSKGQIHLKVASIIMVLEDPHRFIINTGTTEIQLRASTVAEKINWVNALKKAQIFRRNVYKIMRIKYMEIKITRKLVQFKPSKIVLLIFGAFKHNINFLMTILVDENMSLLTPKLERNSQVRELAQKVEHLARVLKNKTTLCTQMLEDEKRRMLKQPNGLTRFHNSDEDIQNGVVEEFQEYPNSIYGYDFQQPREREDEINQNTIYQSFADIDIGKQKINLIQQVDEIIEVPILQLIEDFKFTQPIKYRNIINNPVFQNFMISNAIVRDKLIKAKDPKEKLNIFTLIKDLIGKDLSKFSVPVFLNEPLSMLQRLGEVLEYYDLLEIANNEKNSCMRMCYMVAFAVSQYTSNIGRTKKPFNPLLGETYELIHPHFNFISEQVSHHPPISAGYAEGPEFIYWGHAAIKSKFTGRSMEIHPLGSQHIILKKTNEHYTFKKCTTYVRNILIGEMYIDNVGEMTFMNHTTGDRAIINLTERGWNNKGMNEVSGSIYNSHGIEKFTVKGRYDQQISVIDTDSNLETVVFRRKPLPNKSDFYYHFTHFALQLNLLNIQQLKSLPSTDCRLRPDQLALEMGNTSLASSEKNRLEEKQRAKRKVLQQTGEQHVPRYFEEKVDHLTQEVVYEYLNNYWELKNNPEEAGDIF